MFSHPGDVGSKPGPLSRSWWPPAAGLQSQTLLVWLSIFLPNRKVNKQLTFTNALLLGYFFPYPPDVLKCVAPDASPPTG